MGQDGFAVVMTTVPDPQAAQQLARQLVEERLAGCVQCMPVSSVYAWDGAVEQQQEVLLFIKTYGSRFAAIESFIREHHEYSVPEILLLPVAQGSPAYLQWLAAWVMHGKDG